MSISLTPKDTIAAITTAQGMGGVAVIRISGDDAFEVADKIFSGEVKSYKTHTAHYGRVINGQGEPIDDVLLLVMKGPRSYTGEDTVEINCHGGTLITQKVLETVLAVGSRAARPGEFTLRAFLNGKLDLAQAEAVQSLIAAQSDLALQAAGSQLEGALSAKISTFQADLVTLAAMLEAWVDYPEEDLAFATVEETVSRLEKIQEAMQKLLDTFHDGRLIRDGVATCLLGCPNVGKSSLMNALLDRDRAIVSAIPGTTRDIIEESVRLGGMTLRLMDTAGIRESEELIEKEGIRRTQEAADKADLILLVLDAGKGLSEEEKRLMESLPPRKTIAVWNKGDLEHPALPSLPLRHSIKVSALKKEGLEELQRKMNEVVFSRGAPASDEGVITQVRHKEALGEAVSSCQNVIDGLKEGLSPEFIMVDMRQCLLELGKIIGTDVTEDILSAIFSNFCVGK